MPGFMVIQISGLNGKNTITFGDSSPCIILLCETVKQGLSDVTKCVPFGVTKNNHKESNNPLASWSILKICFECPALVRQTRKSSLRRNSKVFF